MAYQLDISGSKLSKILDSAENASFEDLVDGLHTVSSPQSILSGVETTFTNNGSIRDEQHFPGHITELWDTSLNIATFSEELDTPLYVVRIEITIDPLSVGEMDFKLYINDTVPKLIQTSTIQYKPIISRTSALFTFYIGEETGYDIKNDGIYITVTPSTNVDIYDKTILIYRT